MSALNELRYEPLLREARRILERLNAPGEPPLFGSKPEMSYVQLHEGVVDVLLAGANQGVRFRMTVPAAEVLIERLSAALYGAPVAEEAGKLKEEEGSSGLR